MKYLFLLRHGEAPRGPGESDRERKLSSHGMDESIQAGKFLKEFGTIPELIKSSDSSRTIKTTECVLEGLGEKIEVEYMETLYNASAEVIIDEIAASDNSCHSLMIVAHNPGITSAGEILDPEGSTEMMTKLRDYEATAKIVVLKVNTKEWSEIYTAPKEVEAVFTPS